MTTSTLDSVGWTYDSRSDCLRDESGRAVVLSVGPAGERIVRALNERLRETESFYFRSIAALVTAVGQRTPHGVTVVVPSRAFREAGREIEMHDQADGTRVLTVVSSD